MKLVFCNSSNAAFAVLYDTPSLFAACSTDRTSLPFLSLRYIYWSSSRRHRAFNDNLLYSLLSKTRQGKPTKPPACL